jgi:hypothetical protein
MKPDAPGCQPCVGVEVVIASSLVWLSATRVTSLSAELCHNRQDTAHNACVHETVSKHTHALKSGSRPARNDAIK